jgi:hypothetical protein
MILPTDMNPYRVLKIQPGATDDEVRRAYMAQVREHPPERDPDGFKTVRAAYEKLRTAGARAHEFLDQFESIAQENVELPEIPPIPLTRRLILLAESHKCEVLKTDFSEDLTWPIGS